ncbi:MAG TPA: stage II sporulation protein M [Drouetiella sp.]
MNVERWLKLRKPVWTKLEELLQIVDKKGLPGLDRTQLQELGRIYRSVSADLSRARVMNLSPDVQVYLNNLLVRAHNQVYQTKQNRWADLMGFFIYDFPRVVRKQILYIVLAVIIFAIPCTVSYFMTLDDVHFAQLEIQKGHPIVSDEMWNMIEHKQMWTDAAQHQSSTVSSMIATNNIRVAILGFILGITYGIGTAFVLCNNGLMLGTTFGVCQTYGMAGRLLAFIAPHGVLEMTAIFISGGAGLLMGKALLFPGQYKRLDALRLAARDAGAMFGGCVPLLLVAGMIEGFVSPRTDLSANIKVIVSLATTVGLLLYLFVPREKNSTHKA